MPRVSLFMCLLLSGCCCWVAGADVLAGALAAAGLPVAEALDFCELAVFWFELVTVSLDISDLGTALLAST